MRFTKIKDSPDVFNLGLGHEHPDTGKLDSRVVRNNDDRDVVLAAVAITAIEFSKHYGKHYIYIEGSTVARTRLYQIRISAFLAEISMDFDVNGSRNGALYKFQKNVNDDSFLVKKK